MFEHFCVILSFLTLLPMFEHFCVILSFFCVFVLYLVSFFLPFVLFKQTSFCSACVLFLYLFLSYFCICFNFSCLLDRKLFSLIKVD